MLELGEHPLTPDTVRTFANSAQKLHLSQSAWQRIHAARTVVEDYLARGEPVYGLNRGLGSKVTETLDEETIRAFARTTIQGRRTTFGEELPAPVVRAIMLVRLNGFATGGPGCSREAAQSLLQVLNAGIVPIAHRHGSIGESDLCVMAGIMAALVGEGDVRYKDCIVPAADALKEAGVQPLQPSAKDGLALISASSLSAAEAALGLAEAQMVLEQAHLVCAMSFEAFRANPSPLHPDAVNARPQPGHARAADALRAFLEGSALLTDPSAPRRLQDPLSYRCAAPAFAASIDAFDRLAANLAPELNGAADNPLVHVESGRIIATGNFHTPGLALSLDAAAHALLPIGDHALKRMERLLDPNLSGLPALLSTGGSDSAGFAPLMKPAQAHLAELARTAQPAAALPAFGGGSVEDIMSLAPQAAENFARAVPVLRRLIAIEAVIAAQALDLRQLQRYAPKVEAAWEAIRKVCPVHNGTDRPLGPDIERVDRELFATGAILDLVRSRKEQAGD